MLDERPLVAVKNIGEEVEVRCFEIDKVVYRQGRIYNIFFVRGELRYLIQFKERKGIERPYYQIPGTDDYLLRTKALKILEELHRRLKEQPSSERPKEKMVVPDRLDRTIEEIKRCRGLILKMREGVAH